MRDLRLADTVPAAAGLLGPTGWVTRHPPQQGRVVRGGGQDFGVAGQHELLAGG